jgi:16S rRNA (cytidine1402-2'-O)-methyltransferase
MRWKEIVTGEANRRGSLYVVATPIGNLADLSMRAIETLKSADVVAAEDTRVTRGLLAHFGIGTRLIAVHEHNERDAAAGIVKLLASGQSIALVSDAGTPGVSDPGAKVVRAVREAGFDVVPIPGACALAAAMSASGMAEYGFTFAGFLPAKSKERTARLNELAQRQEAIVFYEAPHRIVETIEAMRAVFGDGVSVLIAREITKKFEELHVTTLGGAGAWLLEDENRQRGEFVIVIENTSTGEDVEAKTAQTQALERTLAALCEELPLKQAVALAVKLTGEKRNVVYELALKMKEAAG